MTFPTERHPSVDRGPALQLRVDRKFPIDRSQPFLHAGEAEARPFDGLVRFKTNPRITHCQFQIVCIARGGLRIGDTLSRIFNARTKL